MRKRKMVIAGGGTGGHIFPAVAIAQQLRKMEPDLEILFIGAKGRMEMEKVPQAGFNIEGLDIAGFNRSSLIKNIWLPFKLVKSWLQVRGIFRQFRPDAVIGVGGYSSFPVLKYAQSAGIPTFIHESNSFAGRSNIMLGKGATRIFVATDGMEKFFPADRITVSGNPVRASITSVARDRDQSVRHFGLDPRQRVVLVVGGSLGARSINEAIATGADRIREAGLQLIWQTGKSFAGSRDGSLEARQGLWVGPFITEMDMAYAAADLVVSRAGAMAIAEITVMGKPAIFVPYPLAAEDHQTANAQSMVQKGAGMMISDADAGSQLVDAVLELARDPQRREALKAGASALAIRDADQRIAREILKILNTTESHT
jgi:UDP-N-acetylglucosamine--N-acetylmuramyl-(pentapeptide) pyrophosphoryl-undecaprenol N-acetylglucosamine transferase